MEHCGYIGLATRQKHRKVEIPVEFQVQDDGAFSKGIFFTGSKSDTESDIEFDIDAVIAGSRSDSDQDSVM